MMWRNVISLRSRTLFECDQTIIQLCRKTNKQSKLEKKKLKENIDRIKQSKAKQKQINKTKQTETTTATKHFMYQMQIFYLDSQHNITQYFDYSL